MRVLLCNRGARGGERWRWADSERLIYIDVVCCSNSFSQLSNISIITTEETEGTQTAREYKSKEGKKERKKEGKKERKKGGEKTPHFCSLTL